MDQVGNIVVKLIYLVWLCFALWLALSMPQELDASATGGVVLSYITCFFLAIYDFFSSSPRSILFVLPASALIYYIYRDNLAWNEAVSSKVGALKGAAFDLIRLMEMTVDGVAKKYVWVNDDFHRFAVDGPAAIVAAYGRATTQAAGEGGAPAPSNTWQSSNIINMPADLIAKSHETAEALLKRRLDDHAAFGPNYNGVRQGVAAFLAILDYGQIGTANFIMTEHMKKQRDEFEGKGTKNLPNYPQLKKFLGLPIDWPTGDMPEKLQKAGVSDRDDKLIEYAMAAGAKEKALEVLRKMATLKRGEIPEAESMLEILRKYLRASTAYVNAFEM